MSEDNAKLDEFRTKAGHFKTSLDDEIDRIRTIFLHEAIVRALGLGIMLPILGIKLIEVQAWFKESGKLREIDIFGTRSVAADLRRMADALELAADRAEKESR